MIHPRRLLLSVIRPALQTLPPNMRGHRAECLLMAIALQESGLRHRQQLGGPAKGLWQFELGGVEGVLTHPASWDHAIDACESWLYPIRRSGDGAVQPVAYRVIHSAIRDNDLLACVLARLTLWRLPDPLPDREDESAGWNQYLSAWRPGKPHPERWPDNWRVACSCVSDDQEAP